MSTVPLPDRPNIEQMKKRAKEIARDFGIPLHQAQLNMARGHGFPSWPKLAKHVELVTEFTRAPDLVSPSTEPADEFLRDVCLAYGHLDRTSVAPRPAPELATANVWTAAATGSHEALMTMREQASRAGGPFQWEPLLYLCYGRVEMTEMQAVASARTLLQAGADANAGYLWHGYPTPFTALTGVFGNGEGSQPPHPHAAALARVLLEHGADPNDSQTLYNRQFEPGVEHLELLFEFGLGRGDGGLWKKRLTSALHSPEEMLRDQLRWAIHHNMVDRVQLLVANGADVTTPFDDDRFDHCHGRTPAQFAALCGEAEVASLLDPSWQPMSPADEYIGVIMRGDAGPANAAARQARPSLIVQAAATGRAGAVRAAADSGFDINAPGRSDSPCEMPWQTALHTAVECHDLAMVELLLKLGADPSVEDARFHSTPRGWAEHFGHDDIAALL